jgi:hypothetical protein
MATLRYTLVADGSSDAALKPIIEWLIREHRPELGVLGEYAGSLGTVGLSLEMRIPAALRLFPCDLLIVHRDAESDPMEHRLDEIERAVDGHGGRWIPLIPVRMTEAWLLSDESAIRSASENRSGKVRLNLPRKSRWELLPDPKAVLFEALEVASEKSARALRKFSPARQRALVAQRTVGFSNLRGLNSFDLFESSLIDALKEL